GPHEDRRARAGSARKLGRTRAFVISRVEERNGERKAEPRVVPLNVDHDRERSIAAQPKRRWRRARVKVEGRCYKLAGTLEAHVERVRNRANEAEPTRFCFGATETAGENPAGVVHPFLGGADRGGKLPFGEHHQEAAYFVGNYYLMAPAPTWYRFSARVTFPRSRSDVLLALMRESTRRQCAPRLLRSKVPLVPVIAAECAWPVISVEEQCAEAAGRGLRQVRQRLHDLRDGVRRES